MKKMYIQPTIETNSVQMDGTICAASGTKTITIKNDGVSPFEYDTEGLFK